MKLSIHQFIHAGKFDRQTLTGFIQHHTFPLIEDNYATFVYIGKADAVYLRHFIYGLPSAQPFHRVPDTDFWFHTIELPPKSRVEYKFEIEKHGKRRWIRDPLNPLLAQDPFGANSVCQGKDYEQPDWTQEDSEARAGSLEEFELDNTAFGDRRKVTVYVPARFRPRRRYPLLVVHDGGDYLAYSNLKIVLDNLIHRLEVEPLIVALTHPHDRLNEYPDNLAHSAFLTTQLLPAMEQRYPLLKGSAARGLMGASFGAVAALSTAWRYPGVYGRLLLQSGSFAFTDIGDHHRGPAFDKVVEFVNAFRANPGKPSEQVFVSCGTYESLIYENRSIVPVLQATKMRVRYEEARDGHNWENWRDRLRVGLSWLFPGPLWLVYE